MESPEPKYTSVDLFAGCGGLTRGLESAGFECIAFNELNSDAGRSFSSNFPDATPYIGPIEEVLTDEVLERISADPRVSDSIDLVCGGPPCQGFSGIGHRRTHKLEKEDIPTNHLFHEMIRVIERLGPKAFLFENVQGILSGKWTSNGENGEIFWDVWKAFASIEGYTVQPGLVRGYGFGVPQNRPRVMIIGVQDEFLRNKKMTSRLFIPNRDEILSQELDDWHKPSINELENRGGLFPRWKRIDAPDLIDVIGDLDFEGWTSENPYYPTPDSELSDFAREMREGVQDKDRVMDHKFPNHSERIVEKFQFMIDNQVSKKEDMPLRFRTKKFNQRVTPEKWGESKPWITVTSLPDDYVHYANPRTFSVREWARIQTFPDKHVFFGKRTTGGDRRAGNPSEGRWERDLPIYTQIGNAVPPKMAEALGRHLVKIFEPSNKIVHSPLGSESEQVRRIVTSLSPDDFVTTRISRRAGGFENAKGHDPDAPSHLRAFLKKWKLVDYDNILANEKEKLPATLFSENNTLDKIQVSFNRPSRNDMRFWPNMPFKKRLLGHKKFNGDLLVFMVRNGELILALAGDIDQDFLSKYTLSSRMTEEEEALIGLVNKIVDTHEKGWVDSVCIETGKEPSDKDVGMTLERECNVKPNSSQSPDENGLIEIKGTSKIKSHLDNIIGVVPGRGEAKQNSTKGNWEGGLSKKEICRKFGKKDLSGRMYGLKNNIVVGQKNTHGLMIIVDRDEHEVMIVGSNDDKEEDIIVSVYDFERLRSALSTKHPCTVWAKAEKSDDGTQFLYQSITITMRPVFDSFLNALENKRVIFDYKMHWDGKSSTPRDHGPSFRIKSGFTNSVFTKKTMPLDLSDLSERRNSDPDSFGKYILQQLTR